ncbi:MAG: alkaline phosphatase family protein [Thermodesulfobacteriota bacterium]
MGKKCIFFLADGARYDVFNELLNKGDLKNISRYIVEPGKFLKGTTVFPSTTGPAYTPYLLGKFPGRCNLPGIRWFDRHYYDKELFSFRRFRSYIGPETYFFNHDIDKNFKTIFELAPNSISILNEITRGIQAGNNKTKYRKAYLKFKSHFSKNSDEVDEAAGKLLIGSLKSNPDFVFSVFLGIDSYSHQYHPFHQKVIDSYILLDKYVGLTANRLINSGDLEDTLFVIASDHGLTPTHSHFDSLYFLENKGLKPLYYPNIFKHLTNAESSVMVSGNAMAHLYFKNKKGWDTRTTKEHINDIVLELCERPEIDLVCSLTENGEINIKNSRGEALVFEDKDGFINYKQISGDPLGYGYQSKKLDSLDALKESINTSYPDSLLQLIQLFESPRSGDVILSAKPGFDLRATHENPEHHGSHGSLHKDHMLVPLVISKKTDSDFARSADIFPIILSHLGIETPDNIDGKILR